MKHDTMNDNRDARRTWPMVASLAALMLASACSTQRAAPPEEWWPGVVVGVMRLADMPADVDPRCVQLPAEQAAEERTVVLVRRRIGRSPHTRAFVLAAGTQFNVGERVRVDSDLCQIVAASAFSKKQ